MNDSPIKYPALLSQRVGEDERAYALHSRVTSIGSLEENEVCLEGAEPHHLCILYNMGVHHIKKLSPKALVKVNGKELKGEVRLTHQDKVTLEGWSLSYLEKPLGKDEDLPKSKVLLNSPVQFYQEILQAFKQVMMEDSLDKVFQKLIITVARVIKCDGVNLVQEKMGLLDSLAVFPETASGKRFSRSAIEAAKEMDQTVLLTKVNLDSLPLSESVMFNDIQSVLCSPLLSEGGEALGFLYMDRLSGHPSFTEKDRELFDSLRDVFSILIFNAKQKEQQKDTIKTLQSNKGKGFSQPLCEDEGMRLLYVEAKKLASTEISILINGETGTGKEVLSKYIHSISPRKEEKFIAVNCGAISETLIENELFGHEKGAFTGADQQKIGILESVGAGTLLLDEVGELPLELQVKLLRVLQEGEIRRVGGTELIKVNFRLLSATNRNLEDEVEKGRFRSDLFYRLNVVVLTLPPLRERKKDVIVLSKYFINSYSAQYGLTGKVLGKQAEKQMLSYAWPGNIRELENKIHKAVIVGTSQTIKPEDIGLQLDAPSPVLYSGDASGNLKAVREAAEKQCIENGLEEYSGNISFTAKQLEVDRKVLTRLIEKLGIDVKKYR